MCVEKSDIQLDKLPKHIAIIMDGNGRWATQRQQQRVFGHEQGAVAVRKTVEAAAELGIEYLTLYAFSTENWSRPQEEVDALMNLLVRSIQAETPTLLKNNIRLQAIGDLGRLSPETRGNLQAAIDQTAHGKRMALVLALNYSARDEMTRAVKNIVAAVHAGNINPEQVNANLISDYLDTRHIPDPDLLIRTSGELRISNFLLWQIAYAELYFTDVLWPDFDKHILYQAIADYQKRERRFGKTGEQIKNAEKK